MSGATSAGGAPSRPLDAEELRGDFSLSTDAIGAGFTRACQFLGIMDLHFHDLRHDGVSRLFETGLSIPQVGSVSGYRAWSSLKRYTHLRQTGDKYTDWKWLSVVTGGPGGQTRFVCQTSCIALPFERRVQAHLCWL